MWGAAGEVPDPTEDVVERSVSDQAVGELGDVHRRVIQLAGPVSLGFGGWPAKETATAINDQFDDELGDPMTDVNVHQILSRFVSASARSWGG